MQSPPWLLLANTSVVRNIEAAVRSSFGASRNECLVWLWCCGQWQGWIVSQKRRRKTLGECSVVGRLHSRWSGEGSVSRLIRAWLLRRRWCYWMEEASCSGQWCYYCKIVRLLSFHFTTAATQIHNIKRMLSVPNSGSLRHYFENNNVRGLFSAELRNLDKFWMREMSNTWIPTNV